MYSHILIPTDGSALSTAALFDTSSKGLATARLQGIVERIKYPGLRLAHLHVK
jgi:hypothetical protein